jgi:hypothetical protein
MVRVAALLLFLTACAVTEPEGVVDEGGSGGVVVDRELTLAVAASGGYDAFASPGAAFGYAVDPARHLLLVVGLKFSLPLYEAGFTPANAAASAQRWADPTDGPVPPGVDAASWPLVLRALVSVETLRAMSERDQAVTAILLEGDVASGELARVFVADAGKVRLTRLDDPRDRVEATNLRFREVTALGPGAALVEDGQVARIAGVSFEWATPGI